MSCFFNKVPLSTRLTAEMLPAKDGEFDANAFIAALDAYMKVQTANNRGNLPRKQEFTAQLKTTASDLSSLDKKQTLQTGLQQAADKLVSCGVLSTAGSRLLDAWLEKLNEDPALKEVTEQKSSKPSILGMAATVRR